MNNVEDYVLGIEDSLEKLVNNYEYYKSFGSFYIMSRIREDLENMIDGVNEVQSVANDLNK